MRSLICQIIDSLPELYGALVTAVISVEARIHYGWVDMVLTVSLGYKFILAEGFFSLY